VLSIGKIRTLSYYEREVIDGREDYLSEAGTSPGQWVGALAAQDGYTGPAERAALAAVFSGQHPGGGRLTTHRIAVTGFDLTLSPSKSVSLLWALGSADDAAAVEASLYAARAQVESYLSQHACLVRRGHAGAVTEPGAGFFGAVFRHRTSRLGDPGIHLHWTVFNVTEGADGRRTALDARALYHHRYASEAVFQAALRHELTTRLGVVFDEIDQHGVAEIVGISGPMRAAFSRRRAEIVTEMSRVGSHTGAGARMAALTTRKAKPKAVSETELRAEWRARASELRFDLDQVVRVPRTPRLAVSDTELAETVTTQHATFELRDLVRAVAGAARQGATVDTVLARAQEFLAGEHAVCLGEVAGHPTWTTRQMLALEQSVLDLAASPPNPFLTAKPSAVTAATTARPSLTGEQHRMVTELCSSGRPVEVVVGHAGTGKTFTLDAVREAFEASGHRVLGACLAARAPRELTAGSGIAASTAHSLGRALDTGRLILGPTDVLVVDEAGMLGTRQLAALAQHTASAGAKLILVGDPKQLPEVSAGGLFTALARRQPVIELIDNRRQLDPAERLISAALRHGSTGFAVRQLDRHGRLTTAANSDALRDQLIEDWTAHRQAGAEVLIGATNRADVRDLNSRAHTRLEQTGQLGPLLAIVDDQRFCAGEQLLALRNNYDLGILNGDLATLVAADDRGLLLQTERGELQIPLEYASRHLQHAYARTVHKSQGLTCDVALLLGDDSLYAELGYTALTRGRQHNHLYAVQSPTDEDGRLADLIVALGTSRAKTAALDTPEPLAR
jgi:conjugative relaxase-like TrwC/TraI family protein